MVVARCAGAFYNAAPNAVHAVCHPAVVVQRMFSFNSTFRKELASIKAQIDHLPVEVPMLRPRSDTLVRKGQFCVRITLGFPLVMIVQSFQPREFVDSQGRLEK